MKLTIYFVSSEKIPRATFHRTLHLTPTKCGASDVTIVLSIIPDLWNNLPV